MQTISQEDFVFMFTIISFILTILGCINWLMVGLLQYDFVAGIFGYQASILSRIVYIIIGASSLFLVYKLIKGKGTIAVFSRRNKKDLAKNISKMQNKDDKISQENTDILSRQNANVEASDDILSKDQYDLQHDSQYQSQYDSYDSLQDRRPKGLFNEHFDDRDIR